MATDTLTSPTIAGGTTKTRVFKNFIDGEWVESVSGRTFEDRNPADTREVVAIFQRSNKADVDAAVDAAKRAFAKWRLVPAPRRAEMVFRAAEIPERPGPQPAAFAGWGGEARDLQSSASRR
jgi:aldehyde dehydrogenase (NAD+)